MPTVQLLLTISFVARAGNKQSTGACNSGVPTQNYSTSRILTRLNSSAQRSGLLMAEPVSCPLGFGTSITAVSQFHCTLCRGLLHEPVKLKPCDHSFCSFCISPARACPTCGQDIVSQEPDVAQRDTVKMVISTHWRHVTPSKQVSEELQLSCHSRQEHDKRTLFGPALRIAIFLLCFWTI